MPWKKLYLRVRNYDEDAYKHVKSLCCPVFSDGIESSHDPNLRNSIPIVTVIRYVTLFCWMTLRFEFSAKIVVLKHKREMLI